MKQKKYIVLVPTNDEKELSLGNYKSQCNKSDYTGVICVAPCDCPCVDCTHIYIDLTENLDNLKLHWEG